MKTESIRAALKVAKHESLSGAACELRTDYQTVMAKLNVLERELGFKLFERRRGSYHNMLPTEQGRRWLIYARRALELLEQGKVVAKVRKGDGL